MGFGNKSSLGFTTNKQSVRYVRGSCGVTGNLQCAINSLYMETATQPLNITSVQLVANTNNIYGMYGAPDYVYVFTLNSTSSCGFFNGENFTFTINDANYSFSYTENCTSTTNDYTILVPALSSSNITTSQENGNYYTIDSGTYTISLNSTQMSSTVTFDSVTIGSSPSQTITVN